MNRNPVIPYILIMIFGLALIFFLAVKGLGDSKEIAKDRDPEAHQEEAGATAGEFDPEGFAQTACIGCHGTDLGGGMGPSLIGMDLSADEIEKILVEGKNTMPAGLVPSENMDQMVEWLLSLE